jgi:hypothetical protein
VELDRPAAGERGGHECVQQIHQPGRVLAGDVTGGEVVHDALDDPHQVAAVGHVLSADIHTDARRLEGRAPRVDGPGVVAEHGEVGNVAAGRHALGHGAHHPDDSLTGEPVEVRRVGRLEGRPARQLRERLVGHAVGHHHDPPTHALTPLRTSRRPRGMRASTRRD